MKKQYANLGSISTGTMRNEDLIPDFLDTLETLANLNKCKRHHKCKRHLTLIDEIENRIDTIPDYYNTEDADIDLNEDLFDALNEYAPPHAYFGSHPGDGSDYGFWIAED